ncbi:MAG: phytanoyl-CoA dioxygenase family protein [Sphingomonadaceae bacterium]
MSLVHLPGNATAAEAIASVKSNGYVIIDSLASKTVMDQLQAELSPYIENTSFGSSEETGRRTRRTGSLVARSETARSLIAHPIVLAVCDACLPANTGYHLSLTEVISLWPGAEAQFIHRDELGYGAFPFPVDYEVQISTLWAMSDYTEEMGATRVVPGSHRLPSDVKFTQADTVPAVMERGSVMIYSGKLYHGGGENRSDRVRQAMNVDYGAAWTRQEENQYLSCPPEVARTLPDDFLKLMGYRAFEGWGRVGDWIDPLSHLRGYPQPVAVTDVLAEVYQKALEENA